MKDKGSFRIPGINIRVPDIGSITYGRVGGGPLKGRRGGGDPVIEDPPGGSGVPKKPHDQHKPKE